ncbi:hypothetical protein ACQPXT_40335 [Streptomyces sp. CA-100214]
MSRTKVVAVAVLVTVLAWSTVMIVLGHAAAAAVLLPSAGLLVQQTVQALTATGPSARPTANGPAEPDGQEASR